MKRLLVVMVFILVSKAFAVEMPQMGGRVNDYAGALPSETIRLLDSSLAELESTHGVPVILATLEIPAGENPDGFISNIADAWRKEKKELERGFILFISEDTRRAWIEVGMTVKTRFSDNFLGHIVNEQMIPRLQRDDVAGCTAVALSAIRTALIEGETASLMELRRMENLQSPFLILLMPMVIASILLATLSPVISAAGCGMGLPAVLFYSGLAPTMPYLISAGVFGIYYGYLLGIYIKRTAGEKAKTQDSSRFARRLPPQLQSAQGGIAAGITFLVNTTGSIEFSAIQDGWEFRGFHVSSDW